MLLSMKIQRPWAKGNYARMVEENYRRVLFYKTIILHTSYLKREMFISETNSVHFEISFLNLTFLH